MSVHDLYDRHAEAWAGQRRADSGEGPWIDRVCSLLAPRPATPCSISAAARGSHAHVTTDSTCGDRTVWLAQRA